MSSFLHHLTPGKTTLRAKVTCGNRKRLKATNFCHSASSDVSTVLVSLSSVSLSSVGVLAGVLLVPVGHPRYLCLLSQVRGGMASVQIWGENKWSTCRRGLVHHTQGSTLCSVERQSGPISEISTLVKETL